MNNYLDINKNIDILGSCTTKSFEVSRNIEENASQAKADLLSREYNNSMAKKSRIWSTESNLNMFLNKSVPLIDDAKQIKSQIEDCCKELRAAKDQLDHLDPRNQSNIDKINKSLDNAAPALSRIRLACKDLAMRIQKIEELSKNVRRWRFGSTCDTGGKYVDSFGQRAHQAIKQERSAKVKQDAQDWLFANAHKVKAQSKTITRGIPHTAPLPIISEYTTRASNDPQRTFTEDHSNDDHSNDDVAPIHTCTNEVIEIENLEQPKACVELCHNAVQNMTSIVKTIPPMYHIEWKESLCYTDIY